MSNIYYIPSGTTTITSSNTTTATSNTVWISPTTTGTMPVYGNNAIMPVQLVEVIPEHIVLLPGEKRTIAFPDGTTIELKKDGSYVIEDKDAKVIYKAARVRDFNPFINASDKLEDFIKFCGSAGVRRGDMLGIPIKLFVQWLVIEAARADGEPTTEVLMLPKPEWARCLTCGRFISPKLKANRMEFCRPSCFEAKWQIHREKHHEVSSNSGVDSVAVGCFGR